MSGYSQERRSSDAEEEEVENNNSDDDGSNSGDEQVELDNPCGWCERNEALPVGYSGQFLCRPCNTLWENGERYEQPDESGNCERCDAEIDRGDLCDDCQEDDSYTYSSCSILLGLLSLVIECCIPTQQDIKDPEDFPDLEPVVDTPIIDTKPVTTTTFTSTTSTTTTTTTTTPAPVPKCPDGWTILDRGTYSWCIYFYIPTIDIFYNQAVEACKSLNPNAVLSGFQSFAELKEVVALYKTQYTNIYVPFWIGARRTPECLGQVITDTCTATTSFYWTDGHTTGSDGFYWYVLGQPYNDENGYDCAVMIEYFDGYMNSASCIYNLESGAICGMVATLE